MPTDKKFDFLFDTVKNLDPKNPVLKKVGAKVLSKNKVKLPYYMGSMDKIKPTDKKVLEKSKLPGKDYLSVYSLDNAKKYKKTIDYLRTKNKVLLLTTSNRWSGHKDDIAKSTQIAFKIQELLGKEKVTLIDTTKLNIFPCEGNVSSKWGNHCGTKDASLKDKDKNPTGDHRCWASINNKSDELW